jgi:putative addiction module component (TIGR02574 family)
MLSMSIEELEAAAMQLSPTERERLGEKLLSSVDTPLQYEEEWAQEADRRITEMLNGAVERVSGDEVFRAAVDRLK